MAISIEELRDQIAKRVPNGTPIPCTETIRLQFQPNNSFQRSALMYSGRFDVKFRVQTRQARVTHPDARYVATSFKYMKEFCVENRSFVTFVCMDDKAIIPVGEPGVPISTGVRGHNRVLAPADGPRLVATDHDFHTGGLVPSVIFVSNIPRNPKDSFFSGKIYVTTKDKVFQPSTPYRHTVELIRILRDHYSDNEVDLKKPILCLMTDGGPDHRVTFETVKLSLLILFLALDLDMLIAHRTAPNHSWMNPAERCMSILNLALQHCALSRNEMAPAFEAAIKNKATLSAVRNLAIIKTGFKDAFSQSIGDVISLVNARFQRMKLKDQNLVCYKGVSDTDIQNAFDVINLILEINVTTEMTTNELRKVKNLQSFLAEHSKSSHYVFQIKKCKKCVYCTLLNPPRVSEEDFKKLFFLPDPVPGDDNTYMTFSELYGNETKEKHRPGATAKAPENASDKQNRDLFRNIKEQLLARLKEERFYICGDPLVKDIEEAEMVVREGINCQDPIETCYFSASLKHYLPPVCVHCGSMENLLEDTNPYMTALYEKYSTVRSICSDCRSLGKDAKTWGKKFISKKAKH